MATWFLPVAETGESFGNTPGTRFDVPAGSVVEIPSTEAPLKIWDAAERCEGWRWPARIVQVEPVEGKARYWSPHTADASAMVVSTIVDGMPLWGPNGRGVLAFAKRAGTTSDQDAAAIAAAWLRIPTPARRAAAGALRKTIDASGRGGASVAARALAINAFDNQEHQLGRRVAEPVRASLRAAASAVIVRDLVKDARTGLTQKGFDLLTSPWQR